MSQTDRIGRIGSLQNLVVGLDGSPTSTNALEWAAGAVGATGKLEAVHAVRPASDIISAIVTLDPEALAVEAQQRLDGDWTVAVRDSGVELSTRLSFDQSAAALIDAAAELEADAIVVGAHGTGRWSRHYLGSTASKLLHRSVVPVIVVPGAAEALDPKADRVVAGYDGSKAAVHALIWAADIAAERDLPLEVLTVVSPTEYSAAELFSDLDLEAYHDDIVKRVHKHVIRLVPESTSAITENVVLGDPLNTLLDSTDSAWLLVVGRPLSRRLDEYLTGSTARHCAARGHCPVAVVAEA
jgi:nucleotide-binding universal stress UspA family protein